MKFSTLSLIVCFFFANFCVSCFANPEYDTPRVVTSLGKIKGSTMNTRLNKTIFAFRGIRYGEPPIGNLRFKQPKPVEPWSDEFDASKEGPSCPRPKEPTSSEDCLRLNVYTTDIPLNKSGIRKPVIVFFHPGGFYSYSGQSFEFGPEYIMDKEVVFVTVNYRLASLGFLSTGDELIPGNMGLKDQVIALRWVRDHIANFGGDPTLVTITGYSAGSWSCILHLLSPMSRGLFHRVIAMSGSPTTHSDTPKEQRNLVVKQAEALNCSAESLADSIKCLRSKPAQEIADSFDKFNEFYGDPILRWRPVIEPEVPGVERFLTDYPENLIRKGEFAKVPIIAGVNKDEFGGVITLFMAELEKGNKNVFDVYKGNWDHIAPISFLYERDTNRSHYISSELKKFYLNDSDLSEANLRGLADLYADSQIIYSTHKFVNLISAASPLPVYYYNFVYQGRYSFVYYPNTKKPYGVVHHDDMLYLYRLKDFPSFEPEDPEITTLERMTTMFEHFAKNGQPLPYCGFFDKVKWEPYTEQNKAYLEMGEKFTMKSNLHAERMAVWDRLFPLRPLK